MAVNENEDGGMGAILAEVGSLRKELGELGARSMLENLVRAERTVKAGSVAEQKSQSATEEEVLIRQCDAYIAGGDMDSAFLAVLKRIEGLMQCKADTEEISERATRGYVRNLFDHLDTATDGRMVFKRLTTPRNLMVVTQQLQMRLYRFMRNTIGGAPASVLGISRIMTIGNSKVAICQGHGLRV
jgi:hypothetical protein